MRALTIFTIAVLACTTIHSTAAAQDAWTYSEVRDEFAGETIYAAEARSEQMIRGFDGESAHAILQLRCDGDRGHPYWQLIWPTHLRTRINTAGFVTALESAMQVRFDDGRIYGPNTLVAGWPIEDAVGSTQTASTGALKAVLNRALEAETMMVRDTAWDGTTLTVSFSMNGLEAVVEQLGAHCRRL